MTTRPDEPKVTLHCPACDAKVRFGQTAPLKYAWLCTSNPMHEVTGQTIVRKEAE